MQLTIGLIVGLLLFMPLLYGISFVLTILWGAFDIICEGLGSKFEHKSIKCEEPNEKLIEKIYYYPFKVKIIITKDRRLYVCDRKGCSEFV